MHLIVNTVVTFGVIANTFGVSGILLRFPISAAKIRHFIGALSAFGVVWLRLSVFGVIWRHLALRLAHFVNDLLHLLGRKILTSNL